MLAGGDRGLHHRGREVRCRRDQHDVDAAGDDFLVGVEAEEAVVGGHVALVRLDRRAGGRGWLSSRSLKRSAMATRRTSLPAFMALTAASVPRPPQPIRPILITSLPAAWAWAGTAIGPSAAVEVRSAEAFKKSRLGTFASS